VMNYIMGSLRVLTGFTAGVLLLLLITHTVLGKAIQALFEPESAVDWQSISLVGFLGGFAERLVPSLLATFERRAETGTSDDAGGSSTSRGTPVPPVPAAASTSA
jgi:Co/Zn/Cd efflux system component